MDYNTYVGTCPQCGSTFHAATPDNVPAARAAALLCCETPIKVVPVRQEARDHGGSSELIGLIPREGHLMSSNFDNFVVTLTREVESIGMDVRVEGETAFVYDGGECLVMAEFSTDNTDVVEITLKNDNAPGLPHLALDGLGAAGAAFAIGAWLQFQMWARCTGVETRVIAD